jgi:hypothetical protein
MVENVGVFIGAWTIGQISNPNSFFQSGWQLCIGTGQHGDRPPFLTAGYDVCVGFAVLNQLGGIVLATGEAENDPLLLLFTNGALRYAGYYKQSPLRIYISMVEVLKPTLGLIYPAIYGSSVVGDPDQVGVWGAEGNPPPQ